MRIVTLVVLKLLLVSVAVAQVQDTKSLTVSFTYNLQTSCTLKTVVSGEQYYVERPWTSNETYYCWNNPNNCGSFIIRVVDSASIVVGTQAASFSPNPNGQVVHNPNLAVYLNNTWITGPTLNLNLGNGTSSWWEDVGRDLLVYTRGSVTISNGASITTYNGSAGITISSCVD